MLTQTLRQMERDGLVARKAYPVIPPRVEYTLTDFGLTLSGAFCGVWVWAAENLSRVEKAREVFDELAKPEAVGGKSAKLSSRTGADRR
jgi:DNA-binding HxlR family transcriptional regulator